MTEQSSAANKLNGQALVSLVFGILGLIGVCPFVGSIVAIATGYNLRDDAMAKAGVILGWIGLVLTTLAGLVMLFLVPLGMRASDDEGWEAIELHPPEESMPSMAPVNPR